ncbi:hypothetical protein [Baekduia sp. Peel2402]|uniref:hypothetical protein n=1 Tax=Baekduia sp. Peel2402 TaxID=3458296 RepID=UPI00403EB4AF
MATGNVAGEHAPAIRNLSIAGLLAPVEGAWTLTQAGYAVLELEGSGGGASDGGGGDAAGDLKAKIRDWFMT